MNYTPGPNNPYPMMVHPIHQGSSGPGAGGIGMGSTPMFMPPNTLQSLNDNGTGLETMVTTPDMAMIARQGYLQQQQQQQPANMSQYGAQGTMTSRQLTPAQTAQIYGMTPQMQQEHWQKQLQMQAQAQFQAQQISLQQLQQQQQVAQGGSGSGSASTKKKRGPKPSAGAQMIARQTNGMQPPQNAEQYIKNALSASPSTAPSSVPGTTPSHLQSHGHPANALGLPTEHVEPWADSLDELDPREIAMGRFRKRHEVLGEVFGPESIKDIPTGEYDPWEGLGMDGETLEARVLALEKENQELESKLETKVKAFTSRLQAIDSGASGAVLA